MIDTEILRKRILDLAIQGKLVRQDLNDEPASILIDKIRKEKQRLYEEGKLKKKDIANDSIIFKGDDNLHYEKFQDGTTVCIDEDIPFSIPEGWEWCRIGSLFATITGSTPSTKNKEYYGDDYPFYKPSDLDLGYQISNSKTHVSKKGYYNGRPLKSNSVLVTCIGATIGKTGLIQSPGICNQQINAILPSKYIESDYIYYCMSSGFMQNQIMNKASATTLPILKKRNFDTLLFAIPPLREQKRISETIKSAISLINEINTNKEDINAIIESIKTKVLNLAVRGKLVKQRPEEGTAEELYKQIQKEKQILINEGKIKKEKPYAGITEDEIPYDIPKNWIWARLGDIYSVVMGQSPDGDSVSTGTEGMEFHQGKVFFGEKIIQKSDKVSSKPAKVAEAHSVLLCVRAPVGIVNITDRELCIGRGLCCIKPLANMTEDFTFYILSYFKNAFIKQATGTTFVAITGEVVKNQLIPLPPLKEQHRIVEKVEELLSYCERLK